MIILSYVFYFLGDLVSRPMMRFDWVFLYPVYNWLMSVSVDCDRDGRVWESPQEKKNNADQ